jgi:hypothetical protein
LLVAEALCAAVAFALPAADAAELLGEHDGEGRMAWAASQDGGHLAVTVLIRNAAAAASDATAWSVADLPARRDKALFCFGGL